MSAESERRSARSTGTAERRGRSESTSTVARFERPATIGIGGALLLSGLRRRSLAGAAIAAGGGWLLYRGLKNKRFLGRSGSSDASPARAGGVTERGPAVVERSVTVDVPADELHEYWRKPEYLAEIVGSFAQVTPANDERLHWRVEGPMGNSLSWETRFVEDSEGEVLRWETVEGAPMDSEWTVTYRDAPGERGTEVTLRADFDPPGGRIGAAAMDRLDFAVGPVVSTALDRFKSLAETGEIPTLEANPSARGQGDLA